MVQDNNQDNNLGNNPVSSGSRSSRADQALGPDHKAEPDNPDRANRDCLASKSSSAGQDPVAHSNSSKVNKADRGRKVEPDRKADKAAPDKLDRANKDCRASRSNSVGQDPVAHSNSSKVNKADRGRKVEPDRKADKAAPDRLDRANKACPGSRSNSASKALAVLSKAASGRLRVSLAPDKAPRVSQVGQVDRVRQVDQASKSSSASRAPAASLS